MDEDSVRRRDTQGELVKCKCELADIVCRNYPVMNGDLRCVDGAIVLLIRRIVELENNPGGKNESNRSTG